MELEIKRNNGKIEQDIEVKYMVREKDIKQNMKETIEQIKASLGSIPNDSEKVL